MKVSRKEFDELKEKVTNLSNQLKPVDCKTGDCKTGDCHLVQSSTATEVKKKREPTKYNKFIGEKCLEIKKENPGMSHTEVFKKATEEWKKNKPVEAVETVPKQN
jgi:hypothetical protein